jgi:hypothetical protein
MDAADLAREVVAFANRERPSNLALVVKRGFKPFLKVTAPIENGRRLLRITQKGITKTADFDYNNLDRVSIILESAVLRGSDPTLFLYMDNKFRDMDNCITYWNFSGINTDDRQVQMQDLLKCLFTCA